MEKDYGAKHAQSLAWQRWVTPWEELHVKGLGSPGMDDLLGGKKRVIVSVDHLFQVILLCNFKRKTF